MSKVCDHILNIKVEKVGNHVTKCPVRCTDKKKHISADELDLCLSCGETRCCGYEQSACSYQHYYGAKHPIVFRIRAKEIYCLNCQTSITTVLSDLEEDERNKNKI